MKYVKNIKIKFLLFLREIWSYFSCAGSNQMWFLSRNFFWLSHRPHKLPLYAACLLRWHPKRPHKIWVQLLLIQKQAQTRYCPRVLHNLISWWDISPFHCIFQYRLSHTVFIGSSKIYCSVFKPDLHCVFKEDLLEFDYWCISKQI